MTVLVSAAEGRTGRCIVAALRARNDAPPIRAMVRRAGGEGGAGVQTVVCNMDDPADLSQAVKGVDTVVHYGPPLHPRETAMGIGMIDAARAAGVRRFVFISVIHPEIDQLVNHRAKLAIESHLIDSRLDWTVLRPQHYMQNIDVQRVVAEGRLVMPYPVETTLGHVDLRDLAEVAAKVAIEDGHSHATYDIACADHLSVRDICAVISRVSGRAIEPVETSVAQRIAQIAERRGPLAPYTVDAFERLFGYYARMGIAGNPNVLTWLLNRPPTRFEDYVRNQGFP